MTKAELENKNQADMVAIRLYRNAQEAYQKRTGQDLKSIERIVAAAREAISKGVE
jgi:hypothetical protein